MSEGHNFKQRGDAILALSQASDWEVARKEWRLVDISEAVEPETCRCGHFPIIEICTIANRVTGYRVEIGNRCVCPRNSPGIKTRSRPDCLAEYNRRSHFS